MVVSKEEVGLKADKMGTIVFNLLMVAEAKTYVPKQHHQAKNIKLALNFQHN
jgi:hypothetical protein